MQSCDSLARRSKPGAEPDGLECVAVRAGYGVWLVDIRHVLRRRAGRHLHADHGLHQCERRRADIQSRLAAISSRRRSLISGS